ncbi:MAG: Bax inhibitor-1/YccA family protein [Bacteroidota bacterium]
MSIFKSGNPTLSEKQFQQNVYVQDGQQMTVKGTMNKFGFLMLMLSAGAFFAWNWHAQGKNIVPLMMGGAIGGLVVAIVIMFKKSWSGFLAPAYGILEGLFVGGVSAFFNHMFQESYPDIIIHAVGLTLAVALTMYLLYAFRIIKVTDRLRSIILIATVSIAVFYLITWILGFFDIQFAFLHEGSTMGIIFSLVVIVIAALNLLLDFDMIEQGSAAGAPKYMEWYAGFGLLVTLVWLYIEILRLLTKLNSRD